MSAQLLPSPRRGRPGMMRIVTISIIAFVCIACSLSFEITWLRDRREARAVAWADERVLRALDAARLDMAEKHWNEAIRRLETSLDERRSNHREEVRSLLEEACRSRTEALLEGAYAALEHRRIADGRKLLDEYLAHPQASDRARAERLRDELQGALSDDEAAKLLARLSDEALTVFVQRGQLTLDDCQTSPVVQALFLQTLKRNVAKEIKKREAQREVARSNEERRVVERKRQRERLRASPAFRSLAAYLARTVDEAREQRMRAREREAELSLLFDELCLQDETERQRFRADLLDRQTPTVTREQVERRRDECKRAFRDAADSTSADQGVFDRLVDEIVDEFWRTLP